MSGLTERQPPRPLPEPDIERDGVTLKPHGVGARMTRSRIMIGNGYEIVDNRGEKPVRTVIFTPTKQVVRQTSKYNPRDEDRKHAEQRRKKP